MPNFVIEIKPTPELLEVLKALVSVFLPKSGQPVNNMPTAPASFVPAPVMPQQQFIPPQMQKASAPQYPAPTAPLQQPQYAPAPQPQGFYPSQQAPVNPTLAPQQFTPAIVAIPAAPYQTAPMPYPSNQAPQQITPAQPMPQVPTTQAANFTYDDLARAASALMDAGKQQQCLALLAQFGVPRLDAIPKEQYGAFATELRKLGAQI